MLVTEMSPWESPSRIAYMLFGGHLNQHTNSTWAQIWETFVERVLSTGRRVRHRGEFRDAIFHPSEQGKERKEERDQIKLSPEVGEVHGEGHLAGLHLLEQTDSESRGLPLHGTHPRTNPDDVRVFVKVAKERYLGERLGGSVGEASDSWFWLRSWSQVSRVRAPRRALRYGAESAWDSLPLSAPPTPACSLARSLSLSFSLSLSLSQNI